MQNMEWQFLSSLQVRLWDIMSGAVLDTCDVGLQVAHSFYNYFMRLLMLSLALSPFFSF